MTPNLRSSAWSAKQIIQGHTYSIGAKKKERRKLEAKTNAGQKCSADWQIELAVSRRARDSIYLDLSLSGENGKYAKEALGKLPEEIGRKSPPKVEDTRIAARGAYMEIRLPEG